MLTSVHICLLGRFEVAREERLLRAAAWSRRKAAHLLQRMALERRLVKDQAIDFLWPEADLATGANNLYRTLHALRQTLDTVLGPGSANETITFEDGVLSLNESVWVDAHEFERLCSRPNLQSPTSRAEGSMGERHDVSQLEQALALYQGDLLPDELYAEWTLAPREALRRLHHEASLALATHRRERRDYNAAIALLTPLLAKDPADEVAHRELMRIYALAGRRHDALRQYQACIDALAGELDAPPETETTALYTQILNGELTPLPLSPANKDSPEWEISSWLPPIPISFEVERSAPLVGRETELETLRAQMHLAWRGRGQTILLTGDAGVGKTRLAYETLRVAASAGMTTLFGAAYEQEGQLPYQPFIEAFDRYLAERHQPAEPDRSDVSAWQNPITHFKRLGSSDPQQEHWALFNATVTFLTSLARRAPIVLLVDDLHAADETSLRLFHYLARQTRTAPVILLATCRAEVADAANSPFNALLNALYRERLSETLRLSPLSESAVGRIVAHTLGGEAAPTLVKTVFDITEGNPFFVEEITRSLVSASQSEQADVEEDQGQWRLRPGATLRVPASLGWLLRERVTRLGLPVDVALTVAAVIGREFDFEVLRGVAALPDGALLDGLDAALTGHLLEETASGYCFRHALIRQVLYELLSRPRRAKLHTQAAEAIEALYTQRTEGLDPYIETLAFHYELSDRRDRAFPYLLQAGGKAANVYAFEVAIGYFERALALMDELGLADPARRWAILEPLGWWGIILADTPAAVARFEQALALAPKGGEGERGSWQPAPHDRARLHRGAAITLITAGDTTAAEAHLSAALAEIDEHDTERAADYAYVLYNVAQLHWHRNEYQEAFNVAQRSLAIAEQLNDTIAIARAFEMLALACHSLGEWRQGLNFEEQRSALVGPNLDVTEAFDVHL